MLPLTKRNENTVSKMDSSLRAAFSKVKEEFAEHLDCINENTNEIQANYECVCRIDAKLDKLSQRLEEVEMFLHTRFHDPVLGLRNESLSEQPRLTDNEQRVFLALYTLSEGGRSVTYNDLADKTGFSEQLISGYITNLIEKGVAIIKKYSAKTIYLSLDNSFREQQTKGNILGINTAIREEFVS